MPRLPGTSWHIRSMRNQSGLRRCFSVPDFRKGHHNRYFKITLASLLNREGQVLARSTGTTFSYKRSVKDSAGERVTLLPGTTLLHINRPWVKIWPRSRDLKHTPVSLIFNQFKTTLKRYTLMWIVGGLWAIFHSNLNISATQMITIIFGKTTMSFLKTVYQDALRASDEVSYIMKPSFWCVSP